MMMSEFIERTGFEPTAEEYAKIENNYCEYDGNKDDFCKHFLEVGGAATLIRERARTIQSLKEKLSEEKERQEAIKESYEKKIAKLQGELDKELGWTPCDGGTNFEQKRYEELEKFCGTDELSEQAAKELLYKNFGFAVEKITIVKKVSTYEANKYHRMRVAESYERKPLYDASDWNYIRFDCADWSYEMINGEIRPYSC